MITVIGIIISISLLSLGVLGDDRQLRTEAQRIASIVEVAQDEAVMQGREFGLEFMASSYRFVEYDPLLRRWYEVIGDDVLRFRKLPEDVEFDLLLEDKIILLKTDPQQLDEDEDDRAAAEAYAPHVMVFSSGESTPFELHIVHRAREQMVALQGDITGSIEIVRESE